MFDCLVLATFGQPGCLVKVASCDRLTSKGQNKGQKSASWTFFLNTGMKRQLARKLTSLNVRAQGWKTIIHEKWYSILETTKILEEHFLIYDLLKKEQETSSYCTCNWFPVCGNWRNTLFIRRLLPAVAIQRVVLMSCWWKTLHTLSTVYVIIQLENENRMLNEHSSSDKLCFSLPFL